MSTIVTRAGKGSALTHNEVDANFTNLNTDKLQSGNTAASLTITSADINGGTVDGAVIGGTAPAAGTFTSLTDSGNLTFTGTGNRITGDFSNATIANRVAFQTSTVNGSTGLVVLPNGTGLTSQHLLGNNSDLTNAGLLNLQISNADARISSTATGTGTFLPMTFLTFGSEKLRIAADGTGTYTFGGTAPRITGDFSNATVANRVMFQTSTANGITQLRIIPNGTGNAGSFQVGNSSDPSNSSTAIIAATSTEAQLISAVNGTGTFLPMTFYTGGSERMRVDTSGNVGIGTSSPAYRLQVNASGGNGISLLGDTNNEASVLFGDSGSAVIGRITYDNSTDSMRLWTNAAERMRIDSSGNVGIGTTSPGGALSVYRATGTAQWAIQAFNNVNTGGSGFWQRANGQHEMVLRDSSNNANYITNSSNNLEIVVNGSERARIDASGNLLVGTTVASDATIVGVTLGGGGSNFTTSNVGTQFPCAFRRGGNLVGTISTSTTTTTYNTSSDYRLKENIAPMTGALSKVAALKPVTYKWKADGSDGEGFIAHELAEVVPQCVTGEKDAVDSEGKPVYQGIDTSFLVATLTAAIQELKAELDATKAEVAALKGQA